MFLKLLFKSAINNTKDKVDACFLRGHLADFLTHSHYLQLT